MKRLFLTYGFALFAVFANAKGIPASSASILWVVDNSASMESSHEELSRSMGRFFTVLQEQHVEWSLNVISSSDSVPTDKETQKLSTLSWKSRDPLTLFKSQLETLGHLGDGLEEFARPTLLKLPTYSSGVLAIIFFSDQVEDAWVSSGKGGASKFLSEIYRTWPVEKVMTTAFVSSREFPCKSAEGTDQLFSESFFSRLNRHTGGRAFSSCGQHVGDQMERDLASTALNIAARARE